MNLGLNVRVCIVVFVCCVCLFTSHRFEGFYRDCGWTIVGQECLGENEIMRLVALLGSNLKRNELYHTLSMVKVDASTELSIQLPIG